MIKATLNKFSKDCSDSFICIFEILILVVESLETWTICITDLTFRSCVLVQSLVFFIYNYIMIGAIKI